MKRAAPFLLAVALVAASAASALAGDVLRLNDGRLVAGRVVSLDDDGVAFAPEAGGEMRVKWTAVLPLSRFELWESSLAAGDAAGRVALAKFAQSAELYTYARREALKAKGLGYAGGEDLDALMASIDRAEADDAVADADSFVAEGELDKALERVRSYLKAAPVGDEAERVRAKVPDILARIERRDAEAKDADEARKKAEKEGKLKDWIDRSMATAAKRRETGSARASAGFEQLAKGNQTRARDDLGEAETQFTEARSLYRKVKQAAGPGSTADSCDREMKDCDRRTVAVLSRLGRMEVDNKAWKRASPVVDRGLKIDPVDRELLELRRIIDENWVRRKASDVSNAHPRESN